MTIIQNIVLKRQNQFWYPSLTKWDIIIKNVHNTFIFAVSSTILELSTKLYNDTFTCRSHNIIMLSASIVNRCINIGKYEHTFFTKNTNIIC
jgi:hypothetical protein